MSPFGFRVLVPDPSPVLAPELAAEPINKAATPKPFVAETREPIESAAWETASTQESPHAETEFTPPSAIPSEPQQLPIEVPEWVNQLRETEVYRSQYECSGRRPPAHRDIAELVAVLAASGGVASHELLMLKLKTKRLPGLIAKVAKILNYDGVEVLTHKPSVEVRLNLELLQREFGVGAQN